MLSISRELFKAWNDASLLYCHWKSNEHLLEGLNGETDLDVLLSHHDKDRGEKLLRQLDFLKCKAQVGSRYPDVDDWIGFDKPTGSLIHMHLHYSIVTGHKGLKEYDLPWSDLTLETRVFNSDYGVFLMEPNLEIVTLYTRIGLKASILNIMRCYTGKFQIDKDVKREIEWLKKRVDLNHVKQLFELYYKDKAKQVLGIMELETLEASSYRKLRKIAEATFKSNRRVHSFIRLRELYFLIYHAFIKKIILKLKPLITKKVPASEKGVSIAFLGQDGAGKTTVTQKILKWWNWKMDIRYVYFGSGENYSSWRKRLSNKLPSNNFCKYLKAVMILFDLRSLQRCAYKNIKRAQEYVSKGGVVVFDRFPQNDYPGICDGPKIRLFLKKSLGNGLMARLLMPLARSEEKYIKKILIYHPDIVFKLLLPPEESIRRKPQEKIDAVTKKHEIVKSLKFEGSDVYVIDATMPFEEELVLLKKIIWQHIQK